jgi:formylglycine-generating enzyme required for sulfatase activity
MAGNVSEWVQDEYLFGYDHIPTDGTAYESGGGERIIRGGGYASPQVMLETTNRNGHIDPNDQAETLGFRCARNAL